MSDGNGKAPEIVIPVRHRERIDRSIPRIPRYWKNKETGITYEVQRFLRIGGVVTGLRVVFLDPVFQLEFSLDYKSFKEQHEPVGNMSSKF